MTVDSADFGMAKYELLAYLKFSNQVSPLIEAVANSVEVIS